MTNNIKNIIKQKFKHGVFVYHENDKYIGKSLSEYGEWSEGEVELIKKVVSNSENIIEIGSNIGTHTVPLAKHISNGGQIFSFEPQSQNYKLLLNNIKHNEIKNANISKFAISSKAGKAFMNLFDDVGFKKIKEIDITKNVRTSCAISKMRFKSISKKVSKIFSNDEQRYNNDVSDYTLYVFKK